MTDDHFRPWSYREPANGVTLHVNSQGPDGIAFVAQPYREVGQPYEQYGVVVPPELARELAEALLFALGRSDDAGLTSPPAPIVNRLDIA